MKRGLLVLAALLGAACPLSAQMGGPSVSLTGGVTQYDLAGTGTRNFAAARAQLPLPGPLLAEPGITYMRYRLDDPSRRRVSVWMPEVQVQATLPLGTVHPYLGVGGGLAAQRVAGVSETDATLSVAGGARLALPAGWGVGAELRIRAIDPFHGTTADWGLSILRRL